MNAVKIVCDQETCDMLFMQVAVWWIQCYPTVMHGLPTMHSNQDVLL